MTEANRRRVAITAALAAFGLGSFVSMELASAQPRPRPRADSDYDNDGINNKVDRDDDNDGVGDKRDRDDDNDGVRDTRDRDDDNDGVRDRADNDPKMGKGHQHPWPDRPPGHGGVIVRPQPNSEWRFNYRPLRYDDRHYDDLDSYDTGDYDFNQDAFLSHFERDYRRFDRNRDGRLTYFERQAFWIHMAQTGMFGPMSRAQAREMGSIAASFDADGSGRLTRYEMRRLSRFIKARRLFVAFDRDRDGRLFRNETRGWFANQFRDLDVNRDRKVTMRELRAAFLTGPRRTYWSWR